MIIILYTCLCAISVQNRAAPDIKNVLPIAFDVIRSNPIIRFKSYVMSVRVRVSFVIISDDDVKIFSVLLNTL
jgi:hypothetical protein